MNILLIDQIYSVSYKYTSSLALALGVRNKVFIAGDFSNPDILSGDHETPTLFHLFTTAQKGLSKITKLRNYCSSYRQIIRIIKKYHINAVYAEWFSCSPIDYFYLKKIARLTKLLIAINDILPFDQKFYDYHYLKKIYALPKHVVVMAESNVLRFGQLFPSLAGKAVFIPLGNVLKFGEKVDKKVARNHLSVPSEAFVFLFFGQIKKVKGVGEIIASFSALLKKYPNAFLIIAGKPWREDIDKYQKAIDEIGTKQILCNFSYVPDEDIKYYYGSADICLLPYTDVFQSGVVQLTYAFFKPAIVSDLKPFLDVVVGDETGFICERGSVESLEKAMEKALGTESGKLDYMAEAGRSLINQKFNWDQIAEKTENLWLD